MESGPYGIAEGRRRPSSQSLLARLTLASATPVTTTDQLAKTVLYLTPYAGNRVGLYTEWGTWDQRELTEISVTLPSVASQMYDVFLYDNSSVLAVELVAWTNDTTRATGLALQDGVLVKSRSPGRRYCGSFRTTAVAGQTEDSAAVRFVWNYYNRMRRFLKVVDLTNSWAYSLTAWRQANDSTANQVDLVIGVSEDPVYCLAKAAFSGNISSGSAGVGVGIDTAATNSATIFGGHTGTGSTLVATNLTAVYHGYPGIGRHFLTWMEAASGTQVHTWYGDNGVDREQSGLIAEIMG